MILWSRLQKNVSSPRWLVTFLISFILAVIVYIINGFISEYYSGNFFGLSYGIAASILLMGAALYGVRRRTIKFRIGKRQGGIGETRNWLQFHMYGGTLFLLLVFMHSGFQIPKGILTWCLWGISIWTALSGIAGAMLQKWVPRMLSSGLSIEVLYARIPELIQEIRIKAENLVESCDSPIQDFYKKNIAKSLVTPRQRLIYFLDVTGGVQAQTKQFDYLRKFLSTPEKDKLGRLQALYKTKLEIDAHYTLQKALRWWLYIHVPPSLMLIILLGMHLYAVLYY